MPLGRGEAPILLFALSTSSSVQQGTCKMTICSHGSWEELQSIRKVKYKQGSSSANTAGNTGLGGGDLFCFLKITRTASPAATLERNTKRGFQVPLLKLHPALEDEVKNHM